LAPSTSTCPRSGIEHRLGDLRLLGGLDESPAFQGGRAQRDAHGGAEPDALPGVDGKLAQHLPDKHAGRLEIGDHAVLQRSYRDHVDRCATEDRSGLVSDGEDLVAAPAGPQDHDGGLIEDDASADVADDGVRGAEIDAEGPSDRRTAGTATMSEDRLSRVEAPSRSSDPRARWTTVM